MNNRNVIPEKFKWLFRQLIPNFGTILVVAVLLFASNAYAAPVGAGVTPSIINYQCTLTNASGIPLNGNIGMTFKLYAVQSGGTPLWTETHNAISFTNGLCNVSLGSITPIPASVWDSPIIYLGVKVAGDAAELAPRQIVGAVPYAMNATGTMVLPDNSVNSAKIIDGSVTTADLAPGTASKITFLTSPVTLLNRWGANTDNVVISVSQHVPATAKIVILGVGTGSTDETTIWVYGNPGVRYMTCSGETWHWGNCQGMVPLYPDQTIRWGASAKNGAAASQAITLLGYIE